MAAAMRNASISGFATPSAGFAMPARSMEPTGRTVEPHIGVHIPDGVSIRSGRRNALLSAYALRLKFPLGANRVVAAGVHRPRSKA